MPMEKILAGGANTDGKEIAVFEQKAFLKFALYETPTGSAVSYSQLCCCALQAATTYGMRPKT